MGSQRPCPPGGLVRGAGKRTKSKTIETMMGESVADSAEKLHTGSFGKWGCYMWNSRENGIYLRPGGQPKGGNSLLSFAVSRLGPLGKGSRHGGVLHGRHIAPPLAGIWLRHLLKMQRLQLLPKGAKRLKGPARMRLPATVADLKVIYEILDV